MSQATMPFAGEPSYVAGYLYAYETRFVTAEAGYLFESTAPQPDLENAIAQAVQGIAPPPPPEKKNQNTIVTQFQVAWAQLETLETTVATRALTAGETRQAWALMVRTLKNLIRYVKQDFTSATPPTGPDERKPAP